MNRVILVGNLGKEPECKALPSGKRLAKFSLAVPKKKGGKEVYWINVAAWEKLAEIVEQYLVKGSKILVEGKLISTSWEHQGQKKNTLEVWADQIEFLDDHRSRGGQDEEEPPF